jgi:hypothetical protein
MGFFDTCKIVYSNCLVALLFSFLFLIYSVWTSGTASPETPDTTTEVLAPAKIGSRSPIPLPRYYTKPSSLLAVLTLTVNGGSLVFRDNRRCPKLMALHMIFLHRFMKRQTMQPFEDET